MNQETTFAENVTEGMNKMYNLGIEHAIEIVKSQELNSTDINVIIQMANTKNLIISKLLNLTK